MDKNNKVYLLLKEIGLTDENITKIIDENHFVTKIIESDLISQIKFLYGYNLTNKDIVEIANKNPWILTESFERMRMLEKNYNNIGIKDMKELLLKQPNALSLNPLDVNNLIQKLKDENNSTEDIKEMILEKLDKYLSI